MVALSVVESSNRLIASTFPQGLVAVFVGGTSGVGEYTVKAFAQYAPPGSRAYIIGRSREAADRIIEECRTRRDDDNGPRLEFIQADVSLIKNVDKVCAQIKEKEEAINILFETQGTMGFNKKTSEGLPLAASIVMHSRMRFMLNLLPLIQKAQTLRRVVSVLAASCEGPIDTENMAAIGFSMFKRRDQLASMETLVMREIARRGPDVSFVHTVPGVVKGGITRENDEPMSPYFVVMAKIVTFFIETSPTECGERHLFMATTAVYPAREGSAVKAGVSVDGNLKVARGSDGQTGSGMYSVDNKGESSSSKVEKLIDSFEKDGTAGKVWDWVVSDFKRITGTEYIQ